MKQFHTAAKRGEGAVPKNVEVEFEWEADDGEMIPMVAHPPTSGQVALFLGDQSRGGSRAVRALFDFLAAVLDQENYDVIEAQLREGLDVAVVIDAIEYMIEEWGARPTKPPSVSSLSRRTNGQRSTARRPRAASTT